MKVVRDAAYGPHGERNLLDLYLPDEISSPRPLVVCIHGGGWSGGGKEAYSWMAESLVSNGFAAACITYRFWPRWLCPAAINDAKRAVRWLRANAARLGLDSARVGAIGGSAGGHLASYLGVTGDGEESTPELAPYSGRVQCVVDCYGPVDFVRMMRSASAPIVEGFMGGPLTAATEPAYRPASPFFLVRPGLPPFLIVHGTRDDGTQPGDVPVEISTAFHEKLREAGADSTLLLLEGAPHGFSGDPASEHTQRMWQTALTFFRKHLRA